MKPEVMGSQDPESPFPRRTDTGTIVDEVCTCECRRSAHNHSLAFGHGCCRRCSCAKFTWAAHVYHVEVV